MMFREPLPEGCPPSEADEITQARVVFRLVHTDLPTGCDFRSKRSERPNDQFGVSECQALGLSVFSQVNDARKQLKIPALKGMLICQVTLVKGAGYLMKTGRRSHFTWWPLSDFDVLNNCQMVDQ